MRHLLRTLPQIAPDDMEITSFDLHEIPLYNQDVEDAARHRVDCRHFDADCWKTRAYERCEFRPRADVEHAVALGGMASGGLNPKERLARASRCADDEVGRAVAHAVWLSVDG